MNEQEAVAAWRLFRFNWILIAVGLITLSLGLMLTNFHIRPQSYLTVFAVAAVCGPVGYYNAASPQRRNPRFAFPLTAIAQMTLIIPVMISISYIATSANMPLTDTTLLAFDRAIGFDFRSYLNFVDDRPWLIQILAIGYQAISWPILIIVVILPLAGYYRRVAEFICAFAIALLATICISTLVPAIGTYGALGLVASDFPNIVPQGYYDTLNQAPLLRDGSLRTLDLSQLVGVLTFPSFHAVAAILYGWVFWPIRWLRPFNILCNGAMLFATPIGGGHYLVDVIAGIAVAALSLHAARRIGGSSATDAAERRRVLGEPAAQGVGGVLSNTNGTFC
jgi:PAP2 superfamily